MTKNFLLNKEVDNTPVSDYDIDTDYLYDMSDTEDLE